MNKEMVSKAYKAALAANPDGRISEKDVQFQLNTLKGADEDPVLMETVKEKIKKLLEKAKENAGKTSKGPDLTKRAKGGMINKYAKGGEVKKYMGGGSVHKNKKNMITTKGWGASRKT
jgi:hypothetical protein